MINRSVAGVVCPVAGVILTVVEENHPVAVVACPVARVMQNCVAQVTSKSCRDGKVRIQRALKLANVDLGCLNVMASPSLFLHFFRQLVFPCSYLIRGTISTSVLGLVKNIFTPFDNNSVTKNDKNRTYEHTV